MRNSLTPALAFLVAAFAAPLSSLPLSAQTQPSVYEQVMGVGGGAGTSGPDRLAIGDIGDEVRSGEGRANQIVNLPDPRVIANLVKDLRGGAMNVVSNCNYSEYLDLANDLAQSSGLLQHMNPGVAKKKVVPVMDAINVVTRPFQTKANREQTRAQAQTLALTLEQTCNTMRQASDMNRQYEIFAHGRLNIGNAIEWMGDNLKLEFFPPTVAQEEKKSRVQVDLDRMHGYFEAGVSPRSDTTWAVLDATLRETLKMGTAYDTAIVSLGEHLERMEPELWLLAEYTDSVSAWTCPEGYPDPNRQDVQMRGGERVCGPATPERSIQMSTDIAYHDSHLRALEIKVMNQIMQVEAVRLMMNNHTRKGAERMRYSTGSKY